MLMTHQELGASEIVSFEDLRAMADAKSPCITVAVAIPNPLQIRAHTTNTIREVEKRLHEANVEDLTIEALVEPIRALVASIEAKGEWAKGLILYRSPDLFRHFSMRDPVKDFVHVGHRFQIRPLLSVLSRHQRFYLLALSQKDVRLFHCTQHSTEELPFKGLAQQNLRDWMNIRIPDHVLDNRAAAGPSVGSMKGVMFGTSTDRERQDEYLVHFFKEIEKAAQKRLADKTIPLVLAGVEAEVALYRRINTYPRLMERAVHGSPDGLSVGELHERALKIVQQTFSAPLKKVMEEFDEYRGANSVRFGIEEILKAAWDGRVADLLIREDAERLGVCDDGAPQVQVGIDSRAEDLLNLAAVWTVSQKGQAFALQTSDMPEGADAAAILRY